MSPVMHESKLSVSSKGKAREDMHWQLGWWDLSHAVEGTRRPLAWAKSSTIFTAHPTQPQILARHFPSSRQFTLPPPQPIASSPALYEPPTVISIYPTDDWIFAYFPGRGGDGIGCLWRKGPQLDNWTVREWWPFSAGAGVVAADWTCSHREWVTTDSGTSLRLPTRGPLTPVLSSILILVTQDHQIHICLMLPFVSTVTESQSAPEVTARPGGVLFCTNAAIGLNHDDSSILVAMRSHLLPSGDTSMISHTPVDINMPMDWELWGEESKIYLCEASLSSSRCLTTRPMSPITCVGRHLTDLSFFSRSSPIRPSNTDSQHGTSKGGMYLSASFIDFGIVYSDAPKSEVRLFCIAHNDPTSSDGSQTRCSREESKRLFEDVCLAFVIPWPGQNLLLAGLLDFSGSVPHRKQRLKEAPIGKLVVLTVPDLTNAQEWESPPLMVSVHSIGRDVPASVAISPNNVLLCTISSSTLLGTPLSIHSLPHRHPMESNLSRCLVTAIRARHSPSDGEVFGVATEVYRKADLAARSRAAHDVCSLSACYSAFEDCQEGDAYDLNAVWQLIGITTWVTEFTEKILKACVLVSDCLASSNLTKMNIKQEHFSEFAPASSAVPALDSPVFLHLAANGGAHVKRFRDYIGTLSPRGENAQMAKDVLLDVVDCSGVDLDVLGRLLGEALQEAKSANPEDLQRCLSACCPVPSLHPHLRKVIERFSRSDVIDRPRLFIKAADLVDGVTRMSVSEHLAKEKDTDVVSKGRLLGHTAVVVCVRCGGKSGVLPLPDDWRSLREANIRWRTWESTWVMKCVCGGSWARTSY
ncbi:hypothetical protein B0H21DRAFT_719063 [Amylocystis lapponica]|nr:hypothetical protein B0H21DRAFT_719063 [Amylocystis lapponica]